MAISDPIINFRAPVAAKEAKAKVIVTEKRLGRARVKGVKKAVLVSARNRNVLSALKRIGL